MGDCQNDGPFLGTLNIRCRIILGIRKGTIILTTTQMIISTKLRPSTMVVSELYNRDVSNYSLFRLLHCTEVRGGLISSLLMTCVMIAMHSLERLDMTRPH